MSIVVAVRIICMNIDYMTGEKVNGMWANENSKKLFYVESNVLGEGETSLANSMHMPLP